VKKQIPTGLTVVAVVVVVLIVAAVLYFGVLRKGPGQSPEEAQQKVEQVMQKSMSAEGSMEPTPADVAAQGGGAAEPPMPDGR